jgi:hypothetical protein
MPVVMGYGGRDRAEGFVKFTADAFHKSYG